MVTLIFITILSLMLLLMGMFDSIIYDRTYFQSIVHIYPFELGTRRTIVTSFAVIGLLLALYIDYKEKKQKKGQQSTNK
ncbi:hypothetical protein N0O92_10475 [Alkalihalobacillus sp. MEB130]|uniref:hypothetical protein n=1 Tax=Alkalihalobacillus sp. MEB130 TaxID=2976704 RepID=UPI0028DD595D|nr:hypothetical protein [Alkalihalobacillus sp. MEB130]MDT8860658.1 hypothetical protein [Alkalihalobacillus sp. MEB130]